MTSDCESPTTLTESLSVLTTTARRQLFEPFGKSSAQAAETAPGIGLGLSLARRLARDLGGDLRCDQVGRSGLAFKLTLPRAV